MGLVMNKICIRYGYGYEDYTNHQRVCRIIPFYERLLYVSLVRKKQEKISKQKISQEKK